VPLKSSDPAKGKVLRDLLSWIVKDGQAEASGLSYAPLPRNVAEKELKTIYSLQ
jgi:phosphate transport system substrate-binding protein